MDTASESHCEVFNDEEELHATQQATQQAQDSASQSQNLSPSESEPPLWGFLQHCRGAMTRIDLWKNHRGYALGRNSKCRIVFTGLTISNFHCTITWNGDESERSTVTVRDLSSNGTYINGKKIGKGKSSILRDGNEIAFGTCIPQDNKKDDYRFIFRDIANGNPTEGLFAFYDISHEIGNGSFGTVMKAVSRQTGKWYAIKIIRDRIGALETDQKYKVSEEQERKEKEENDRSRKALEREVSIMQKLRHPNVCQLVEVFYMGGCELVLEYVEGGDLLEYILKHGKLSEPLSQHITNQMCLALKYIHSMGIAHRDLKPENILLTKNSPPIVKVADFGLAKAVDELTMLRTMCGTPSYLAPEVLKQAHSREGYDNLVDSWGVGVIVFSMLTSSPPFKPVGKRDRERVILWQILHKEDVSKEAEDFIQSMLQLEPCNRLTMADALMHPWLKSYNRMCDEGIPISRKRGGEEEIIRDSSALHPSKKARKD